MRGTPGFELNEVPQMCTVLLGVIPLIDMWRSITFSVSPQTSGFLESKLSRNSSYVWKSLLWGQEDT